MVRVDPIAIARRHAVASFGGEDGLSVLRQVAPARSGVRGAPRDLLREFGRCAREFVGLVRVIGRAGIERRAALRVRRTSTRFLPRLRRGLLSLLRLGLRGRRVGRRLFTRRRLLPAWIERARLVIGFFGRCGRGRATLARRAVRRLASFSSRRSCPFEQLEQSIDVFDHALAVLARALDQLADAGVFARFGYRLRD